jgi:hypothetical protein
MAETDCCCTLLPRRGLYVWEGDIAKGHDGQTLRMESWMVYRDDPLAMRQSRQCLDG